MTYELVIVGAGIAGLKSALIAHDLEIKDVLIIDYEKQKGGFKSSLFNRNGFSKEKEVMEQSENLPYEIWNKSTAVSVEFDSNKESQKINVQTPEGLKEIVTKKVLLASGSMGKPREGNKIPGTRPAGVMTSLMAAGLLERNYQFGSKFFVIINDKYDIAIADALAERGAEVIRFNREEVQLKYIKGVSRVSEVDVEIKETDETKSYACDTLIYSDGKIPYTFYLHDSNVELDENLFVKVDESGNTSVPRVAAFGSCTNRTDEFDVFSGETEGVIKNFLTRKIV